MTDAPVRVLGRYALHGEIASGGMATVHFGRLLGPVGFSRTVAIKRLHPQFAKDPDFVSMFLDEARVAARIQHPNVVSTLDVVALDGELFLVMDYVEGESLARLIRATRMARGTLPLRIVGSIVSGMLYGLHAAHEAKSEQGEPLSIIHRDVSPQNVLVGLDGVARVLDFGVARAAGRAQTTKEGQIKGKLAYMPPEQILGDEYDRRVDVYGSGVVLWESLLGRRLFDGENEGTILKKILSGEVPPPSRVLPGLPPRVDEVVLCALAKDPEQRFPTAWAFAVAVEEALGLEIPRNVGAFVEGCAGESIKTRAARVRQLESMTTEADAIAGPVAGAPPVSRPSDPTAVESPTIVTGRDPPSTRAILAILAILGAGAVGALGIIIAKRSDSSAESERPEAARSAAPTVDPTTPLARGTSSAIGDTAGPTAPSPLAVTSSATPVSSATSSSTVRTAPSAVPSISGGKGTATSGATTTIAPPPPPPPSPPPPPPTTGTSPDCKQQYYYENGIKKIKPQCLTK